MDHTTLARELRKRATPAERVIWHWLRHRYLGGYKFRRQHPFAGYILDFYCVELKLCIELDGRRHNTDVGELRDRERTAELSKHGIAVIRFWNDDVRMYPDQCWEHIVEVVDRLRRPSPSP